MFELLDELVKEKEAFDAQFRIKVQEAVPKSLLDLIVQYSLSGIHWKQYTPYFNDGDACYFSIHDLSLSFNEKQLSKVFEKDEDGKLPEPVYTDCDGNNYYDEYAIKDNAQIKRCLSKLEDYFSNAFSSILEAAYGEHAEIIARIVMKDGIPALNVKTEECSHD